MELLNHSKNDCRVCSENGGGFYLMESSTDCFPNSGNSFEDVRVISPAPEIPEEAEENSFPPEVQHGKQTNDADRI